ncbi:efflux RND transporter periplasmic adaptor subunit [Arenibacter sp. 6A1]|uniref:efflux RND transporter periplasmic adaptor subunit n=1 Tax=Arenibacter sp. 6A1 TaxID=2720391 RepID=UPI001447F301|nr:efflux RND transporter periplasmic adaptor subunit [Arenibacter sp. 6A1]NKI26675.1 efflux RND transporter periplasmic adaptor subunit [Arenibacter sp. 6A1]
MKKIVSLFVTGILLSSCGDTPSSSIENLISEGNLEAIRQKKTEISAQQKELNKEIRQLDSVIALLDQNNNFPLVTTVVSKTEKFNHYLDLLGDVKTKQNVLIYPESQGLLQKVYVTKGQQVTKGQLLATIDDGGLSSQLAQLKTQAALAQTTFERQKRLWEQKIGSEIQYLQAKANYEGTNNNVKQLESQLSKSNIRAPFSGIIDDVIKDQGTVVAPGPGSEIFRIINLSEMYIEVEVPENYINTVTKGKEAIVYFPILGDSVVTSIRETGNYINPSNRSFAIEIPVPNKNGMIKPNLNAKVSINDYTNENAILLPQGIISENAMGEQYAYVALSPNADGEARAQKTVIATGKTQGAYIEVLSGIDAGMHVIKEGARSVKDGQIVKILN